MSSSLRLAREFCGLAAGPPAGVSWTAMLSVGNRIRSKQSVRKSVPEGHLIVAQYEVLGNCVKRYVRPVGTIERPALGLHTAARAQAIIDRPLRGRDVAIVVRYGVPGKREEGGAFPCLERTNVGASKNARATQRILDCDCSSRNRSLVSTNQTANANDSDL
jgi:hypothetical protein